MENGLPTLYSCFSFVTVGQHWLKAMLRHRRTVSVAGHGCDGDMVKLGIFLMYWTGRNSGKWDKEDWSSVLLGVARLWYLPIRNAILWSCKS